MTRIVTLFACLLCAPVAAAQATSSSALDDPQILLPEEQRELASIETPRVSLYVLYPASVGLSVAGAAVFGVSSAIGDPPRGPISVIGGTWDFGWMWIGVGAASLGILTLVAAVIVDAITAGARGGLERRVNERLEAEVRW